MADKIDEAFEKWGLHEGGYSSSRRDAFRAGFEACRAAAINEVPSRLVRDSTDSATAGGVVDGWNEMVSIMDERLAALGKEPSDG